MSLLFLNGNKFIFNGYIDSNDDDDMLNRCEYKLFFRKVNFLDFRSGIMEN